MIRTGAIRSLLLAVFGALFLLMGSASAQQQLIESIRVHGNRRIPAETIRARIFTREGDVYDEAGLQRDFSSLWNTGYFEDLRIEREDSAKGYIVHFYVKEKPTIREIDYKGLNSVSQSDVLDRFKARKVGLTVENQYDPTKVKRAEVVLKELLSEHGRQFATIRSEVRPIPPAAVAITFVLDEGPKVKVGKIAFEGNQNVSARYLRDSMKNLKPIGLPHSIVLENLLSRTYDATKLQEDTERVRDAYQQKGFFKALVQDPKTQVRDTSPGFPWLFRKGGKAMDITIPVEEGATYRLTAINFHGNKALNNNAALRRLFPMKDGELFNVESVRKGIKNLREAYGEFGYINFTSVPDTKLDEDKHLITLDIDLDEGKPFSVRRIEFQGNTTTRDKVIRRELALEEGGVYNSKLWELSLLRLNQLNYFEPLKPEQDSDVKQDNQESTVDITLKVKEKGKNSIGLTGGVSGLAGSFIGLNYQTNNFLGMGETLTVDFNYGSYQRNITLGFTEPYAFDRPLQMGFTIFSTKYEYNQAQIAAQQFGQQNINLPQNVLNALQDYSQSSTGFTTSASYALRRSFKRVGITYSLDTTSVTTFSQASQNLFENLAFRGISGPNALQGVLTSKVIPSFSFSTIDSPQRPHTGRSFYLATEIAGLGGNVRDIRPVAEFKQWIPMKGLRRNRDGHQTLGFRLQGSFISGFGGLVAPPFQRFYQGGDNDLRGFDIRTVGPYGFIVQDFSIPLLNPDGTAVLRDPTNPRAGTVSVPVPVYTIVIPGGDTSVISNVEYRIPIAGPVTLALFNDLGMNMILRGSQLRISDQTVSNLNGSSFGCPTLDAAFNCGGGVSLGPFPQQMQIVHNSNYVPRMSTGVELQVLMPVVNAPVRLYYAWNPLILNTIAVPPFVVTRSMFPPGGAGDFTFAQLQQQATGYKLVEPRHTFRFSFATTF